MSEESTKNRRAVLRGTLLAAATIGMGGLVKAAYGQRASSGSDRSEFQYRLPPAQAAASSGVMPLGDGAGLYYWDTGGAGVPVVLAHPGTGSALVWPYQQPVLSAAGFRVIAYSRRGYYRSPPGTGSDNGTYAGDLHALVEFLGIDTFHLVGLAAGGFTCTDFAVSYPDRLRSLVIGCSQLGYWDSEIAARLDAVLPAGFLDLPPDFRELGPSYRGAYPQGVKAWLELEAKAHEGGGRVRQKALSKADWGKLNQVPARKLLMAGGADLIQPPSLMRMAAGHLVNCQTAVVPEAGHAAQWERPEVFNRLLIEFLRG